MSTELSANDDSGQRPQNSVEYQVYAPKPHDQREDVADALNRLASEGWRVITSLADGKWLVLEKAL